MRRPGLWPAVLLLPQPPLLILYLLAVRSEGVPPAFFPVLALGVFPLAAGVLGVVGWWRAPAEARLAWALTVGLAAFEIGFDVLAAAMIGFAKAWRSG